MTWAMAAGVEAEMVGHASALLLLSLPSFSAFLLPSFVPFGMDAEKNVRCLDNGGML